MSDSTNILRLGARGSMLSRMQSGQVAQTLEKTHVGLQVPLIVVKTSGDAITDKPLHEFGGKGLFTKELDQALLAHEVDFAVHSFKDVPITMPLVDQAELIVAAIPKREDPRDALVSLKARSIRDLPQGANVGTGSLRRQAQLLALRPDLKVTLLRGNVDTRIRKLKEGQYDAVILACAGLRRSGLFDDSLMTAIPVEELLPAAGQGALCVQCRRDDVRTQKLLSVLHDDETAQCTQLERAVVEALEGDCHSPIATLAEARNGAVRLQVAVGARSGKPPILWASSFAALENADSVVGDVVGELKKQRVMELLHE